MDQLALCNYRTMTAGLSCNCQQVIACRHLTVKGFLFERKAHCVSAQVMRLFLHIHEQNTDVPTTINHFADFTPLRFVTCSRLHASGNLCRCVTHFFSPCVRGTIYCLCCQDYCPTKDKQTDGPFSVQLAKGASLEKHFLIIIAPRGVDARFPFRVGSTHSRQYLKIHPSIHPHTTLWCLTILHDLRHTLSACHWQCCNSITDPVNEIDLGRKNETEKRKWDL